MSDIERRLRALEDRAALQDMAIRYFVAIDDDDYAALEDMFSSEMVFRVGTSAAGVGRADVLDYLREARGNMGVTIHTPDYILVDFEGEDTATGLVGAHLEIAMAGQSLYGAVRYRDRYVRIDGKWRFVEKQMLAFHVGPWADVHDSLTAERRVRWPGLDPQVADLPARSTDQ